MGVRKPNVGDYYGPDYRNFEAEIYAAVRTEAFGVDVGQNSWLTVEELERFGGLLELGPSVRLLDVACGSGGPTLHLARLHGCEAVGAELYEEAVARGNAASEVAGLQKQVRFVCADANSRLPFADESFDAILCIDAICHLPDRPRVLADWTRLLRPGGRLMFTDPVVLTGRVSSAEIATRSVGDFLFLPPGENERLLADAGLDLVGVEDTTDHLAAIAQRRLDARANHAEQLAAIEREHVFENRQRLFDLVAKLASERRLSRFAYTAARPTRRLTDRSAREET
jgi:SAM-dependent methyltransferase